MRRVPGHAVSAYVRPVPFRVPVQGKPHLHKVDGVWVVDYTHGSYWPLGEQAMAVARRLMLKQNAPTV